jgi:hypothetical protein
LITLKRLTVKELYSIFYISTFLKETFNVELIFKIIDSNVSNCLLVKITIWSKVILADFRRNKSTGFISGLGGPN